jgi:hypothetical protein
MSHNAALKAFSGKFLSDETASGGFANGHCYRVATVSD